MNTKRKTTIEGKWIIMGALAAVLLLIGAMAAYFITPGISPLQVGQGDVILTMEDNGKLMVTWPAPSGGALSRLSVRVEGEEDYTVVGEYNGTIASLNVELLRCPFELRIQTAVHGKNLLGMNQVVLSNGSIDIAVDPPRVLQTDLEANVEEPGCLILRWTGSGNYQLCTVSGQGRTVIREVSGGSAVLTFSEGAELELPSYDAPLQLTLRAISQGDGYMFYGPYATPVSVTRESLLGSALSPELQELDPRSYVLRWNETKGEYYEVQEWSDTVKAWRVLTIVEAGEPLRYETGLLRSGSDHRYRVVVYGCEPDEQVEPAEVSIRAGISTLYATVWPITDLTLYEDAAMTMYLDTVPAGSSMCVVNDSLDYFRVRYQDKYGYVDNRFCMINLPEYAGDYCAYNITNSYDSIFMVHDNPIQYITGEVIPGFENINTLEDGFLVPYLYPCAQKLLTAAQAAEEDGYRLRICEAFQPNEATRFLYDTTLAQLDYPLPEKDASGSYVFFDPSSYEPPEEETEETENPDDEAEEPSAGTETAPETVPTPAETPAATPADSEPTQEPEQEPETEPEEPPVPVLPPDEQTQTLSKAPAEPLESEESEGGLQEEEQPEPAYVFTTPTYREIMTDGRFGIDSFLAPVTSVHNRGIALDLTIETLDGAALEMQSAMHDLSWYSATSLNNENAKLLESYMTMPGVSMKGLTSEWWHFQDDDTRDALSLNQYLYKGVTAEGWKNDGFGWRWRYADGHYAKAGSIRVGKQSYTIGSDGYVVE